MARWVLDVSRRPLVVLHLDDASGVDAPDFETMLASLGELKGLARREKLFVVLDLTGSRPDAQRRQRLVEWLRGEGLALRPRIEAFAIVAPSAFLRGALTAVRWFFPERLLASEVFHTRAAALDWIEPRLPS